MKGGGDFLSGGSGNDDLNGGSAIDRCLQAGGSGGRTSCELARR